MKLHIHTGNSPWWISMYQINWCTLYPKHLCRNEKHMTKVSQNLATKSMRLSQNHATERHCSLLYQIGCADTPNYVPGLNSTGSVVVQCSSIVVWLPQYWINSLLPNCPEDAVIWVGPSQRCQNWSCQLSTAQEWHWQCLCRRKRAQNLSEDLAMNLLWGWG